MIWLCNLSNFLFWQFHIRINHMTLSRCGQWVHPERHPGGDMLGDLFSHLLILPESFLMGKSPHGPTSDPQIWSHQRVSPFGTARIRWTNVFLIGQSHFYISRNWHLLLQLCPCCWGCAPCPREPQSVQVGKSAWSPHHWRGTFPPQPIKFD